MMRPDVASRFPNRLTGDLLNDVFRPGSAEKPYYTACYAHYRLTMLISNKECDGRYSKLRWHIMSVASKYCGKKFKDFSCKDRNDALYNMFSANEGLWFDRLDQMVKVAIPNPDLSRDLLKSPPLTGTILANVDAL